MPTVLFNATKCTCTVTSKTMAGWNQSWDSLLLKVTIPSYHYSLRTQLLQVVVSTQAAKVESAGCTFQKISNDPVTVIITFHKISNNPVTVIITFKSLLYISFCYFFTFKKKITSTVTISNGTCNGYCNWS